MSATMPPRNLEILHKNRQGAVRLGCNSEEFREHSELVESSRKET